MERFFAFLIFVFILPILIFIALIIKIKYPGPIFYTQKRIGKNGKPFDIYKMRTMVQNASTILNSLLKNNPKLAKSWAETGVIKNDPRIAGKIAAWSRELSIDELPQLINIIKGDMSFIGPRPLEVSTIAALDTNLSALRHSIKPGLTGLMQVRNRASNFKQMIRYDLLYIKKKSVVLNVYILYLTIFAIINRTGK